MMLAACATEPASSALPPIVFVHGNGGSAAAWMTTLWRFESAGWPRARLHAVDLPYPLARDDDTQPQAGRSSTIDARNALAREVDAVLHASGAAQVVLIASSRGGYAVRNFIDAGGGAAKVSHAILCGTPNHGVFADPTLHLGNEFNGAGPFLLGLNAPRYPNDTEVQPGIKWLTLRSDTNDKYAQPDGIAVGMPGTAMHTSHDGPALRGAENLVLPGADHRETAFGAPAFALMYRFIVGRPSASGGILAEARVTLDGTVSGYAAYTAHAAEPTNLPLAGATVEIYAVYAATGERIGGALLHKTVGADGRFGPFVADPWVHHEFVISAPGYATTHIYRSPFPRSSSVVNLRAEQLLDAEKHAVALVTLIRPRGYLGLPRDTVRLDGQVPTDVPRGVPVADSALLRLSSNAGRPVVGVFNSERLVGRAWPAANNERTYLELTD